MKLTLECERESDGRWLAEIPELPGVIVYGTNADDAIRNAQVLALRVIAERIEHGEAIPSNISIALPAAA
jgi:predicted RNase H-like HicB family nuclease